MSKGLTIFKAFSGVGGVAAAGAGAVVAVKSGIFLKKETTKTTTPQLSSLMSNSLDGDKLAQPSESLETGLFGDGGAGSFLDAFSNPDLLTSLGGEGVLGQHDDGAGFGNANFYDSQTGGSLSSLLPSVSSASSGPDSDDDGAATPDSPISSSDSDDVLSSPQPTTKPDSQDSVNEAIVPTVTTPSLDTPDGQQPAAPAPSDPTNNGDGVGDAVEGDVDGEDKTPTLQTTPAGEGASADSDEAGSISGSTGDDVEQGADAGVVNSEDGSTAVQTTHTDESQIAPDVPTAPAAPEGATGGVAEKSGDEGDKTSTSSLTPNAGATDTSVSTAGDVDDGETVAAGDNTPSAPVVNPANPVETHTPQPAAGGGDGGETTTAVGGVGGAGTRGEAEDLLGSSMGTGGDDQPQPKDASSQTDSPIEGPVIVPITSLFNESQSDEDWQRTLDLIESVVSSS